MMTVRHTLVRRERDTLAFLFHGRPLVRLRLGRHPSVAISSCGWPTRAARHYINAILESLDLRCRIITHRGAWVVITPHGAVPFVDPVELPLTARIAPGWSMEGRS